MEKQVYGAAMERGTVVRMTSGKPVIESIDRPQMVTRPLPMPDGMTVSVGDTVFFFAFDDGSGMIMAKVQDGEG
jgi:hypothetical protein